MSEEQLKEFLEKVKSDTELQEKLKAAASPEAALEIAKEAGFSIASEDIQSMGQMASDAELEAAAGGCARGTRDTHLARGCGPLDQCQRTALDGGTTTQWWCN
ncbi:Nif11-like leader peptide family natural product precursor [Synechococcus sp. NOUM97013]|uniref:Nif11-like leader peptide family natural product precursor n=1 Tax=Synechococcus sp. NOUM97013 TaxID=1442555 RepID=UPI00164709EE|nr:Nif11-like leader peptide family natural product precursor [Synechococcus sp. NOUM97013]QNI73598.1 nif11-like leader peptide domain protein [Synechococcus sp. NOUM97013]